MLSELTHKPCERESDNASASQQMRKARCSIQSLKESDLTMMMIPSCFSTSVSSRLTWCEPRSSLKRDTKLMCTGRMDDGGDVDKRNAMEAHERGAAKARDSCGM